LELGRHVIAGGTGDSKWRRPVGHAGLARIFGILLSLVVVLSLPFGSSLRHRVPPVAGKAAALQVLSAFVGESVTLCDHDEGGAARGSPADESDQCGDTCPLCQLTGHAVILAAPVAIPVIFPKYAKRLDPLQAASVGKPRDPASAQPRAPPHHA
jgi:hypothetical protein